MKKQKLQGVYHTLYVKNYIFCSSLKKIIIISLRGTMEQEVVEFCKSYLVVNKEAFSDPRLELVINDAKFVSL